MQKLTVNNTVLFSLFAKINSQFPSLEINHIIKI